LGKTILHNLLWINDDRDHFSYEQYFHIILSGFQNITEVKTPITVVSQRLFFSKRYVHVSLMLQLQKYVEPNQESVNSFKSLNVLMENGFSISIQSECSNFDLQYLFFSA